MPYNFFGERPDDIGGVPVEYGGRFNAGLNPETPSAPPNMVSRALFEVDVDLTSQVFDTNPGEITLNPVVQPIFTGYFKLPNYKGLPFGSGNSALGVSYTFDSVESVGFVPEYSSGFMLTNIYSNYGKGGFTFGGSGSSTNAGWGIFNDSEDLSQFIVTSDDTQKNGFITGVKNAIADPGVSAVCFGVKFEETVIQNLNEQSFVLKLWQKPDTLQKHLDSFIANHEQGNCQVLRRAFYNLDDPYTFIARLRVKLWFIYY